MDMCRFTGLQDMEYKKVAAALRRMIGLVTTDLPRGEIQALSEERKRVLLDSLRFDQIGSRHMTVKNAYGKTCKWFLNESQYVDWLDDAKLLDHHGFLWIKGKPGAGKSTLMKFVLAHTQRVMRTKIILSFFFNARGEDLEKSTIGMYRSLLLQLLEQAPELQLILDHRTLSMWSSSGHHQWSTELLEELFEQAIQGLGQSSIACFIDALDECDEDQIRDMISFIERVGKLANSNKVRFRICFASRHYPHITITNGLHLVLEGQDGHSQDISDYLDSKLKIGRSKIAEEVREELQKKAAGVFMWVVLVVNILNKEHDGGRIHALRKRLHDIPGNLHQLFRDILMRDSHNKDELLLCVQWVLFAKHPLTPEQLYFSILSGIQPKALSSWRSEDIKVDDIKRFILHSSKGLTEVTKAKSPTVQFIHESVRDFLLKEDGVGELWGVVANNFQGQSHERLKQCCVNYLSIDSAAHLDLRAPLPKASSSEAAGLRDSTKTLFPFLEYAVQNVLYHANAADGCGVPQQEFIQEFQLADWIKLDNLFEKHEIRRHTLEATLLYILAENNMSNLIRRHPQNLLYLDAGKERYGVPLFAAIATGSDEAFRTFLDVEMENQTQSNSLHECYNRLRQDKSTWLKLGRNFKFSLRRSLFSYLMELDDETLLFFLLKIRKVIAKGDEDGRTPLSLAAEKGYEAVVQLILETSRANVDSPDTFNRTPLSLAAERGYEGVVKLLLETGRADVNSFNSIRRTPQHLAAYGGHEGVVKLLLETGRANVDSLDTSNRTRRLARYV
jgi:hypothetical protein